MAFSIATFNVRDLFDDAVPHVIGNLDRDGFGPWVQKRAKALYARKLESVAAMVARMDADIVAFQEIEGAHVLDALRAILPNEGYLPAIAGVSDERGIACGILSRFPIVSSESHAPCELSFPTFVAGDPRPFAGRLFSRRGLLEATLALPDGSHVSTIVAHLKSARPVLRVEATDTDAAPDGHQAAAEGAARSTVVRMAEALHLRALVEARLMRDARIQLAVLGDFNDGPSSVVVRTVAGEIAELPRGRMPDPDDFTALDAGVLHACARAVAPSLRHTILWRGIAQQVDHLLVSRTLWRRFRSARILNEDLRDVGLEGRPDGDSDHAPIVASFA